MEKITTRVKKWGNSLGVILPKNVVDTSQIKEGVEITIFVEPRNKTKVKDVFGMLKGKAKKNGKSTQDILDEIDREFWPEE